MNKIIFSFFSKKIGLSISCELSPQETIHMKCQAPLFFFLQKWEKYLKMSSADNFIAVWKALIIIINFYSHCRELWLVLWLFLSVFPCFVTGSGSFRFIRPSPWCWRHGLVRVWSWIWVTVTRAWWWTATTRAWWAWTAITWWTRTWASSHCHFYSWWSNILLRITVCVWWGTWFST